MKKIIIAPSILSADFANLAASAKLMEKGGADWLHVDVMDGHFVPNITVGPVVVKWLKNYTALPLDVHLMISDPLAYAEAFAKAGAWGLTFHLEATTDPVPVINEFRRLNMHVGISIKPKTPAALVLPYLKDVDMVLVMTVEPGFGGQAFMTDMVPKIKEISDAIKKNKHTCTVEVDGGIDPITAPSTVKAGATALVAGQAIFGEPDPVIAMKALRSSVKSE